MKRDPQTASDLLSVGLSTEAERATDSKPQVWGDHDHTPGPWVQHLDTVWRGGHEIVCHPVNSPRSFADARLVAAAPELLRVLQRLAEKVRRANGIQHSGGAIDSDDWSELYALQGEAFAAIQRATVAQ